MTHDFDPDGPALPGHLFGLPHSPSEAAVVVLPVPFEATTSYRQGTADAPSAVLQESGQVDLFDVQFGDFWRRGVALDAVDSEDFGLLNTAAVADAELARGGDEDALGRVDDAGARVDAAVQGWCEGVLASGRIPAVLGGDHAVALGAIRAAAARHPELGILQVDAHADLRVAYEGFTWSHASVMHNALAAAPTITLAQIGVRDLGAAEHARIQDDARINCLLDATIADALAAGRTWAGLLGGFLAALPRDVWISFDVDGLDPALCPGTGTPVPGGLSWHQATTLLGVVAASGRRIVGFDLCEVGSTQWDAAVGARLLYKLAGCAVSSQPMPGATP